MNPTAPTPTPADDQPVTAAAERLGRPVAIGALALTIALLAWLAVAPTAIAGPLTGAPFEVDAQIVTGPDDEGCLRVVDGTGDAVTHCLTELAVDRASTAYRYRQATFIAEDVVMVVDEDENGRRVIEVDAASGELLEVRESSLDEPFEFGAPTEPPLRDGREPASSWVGTDGDRVVRYANDPSADEQGEVLLDLDGPPGFSLQDATISPDGRWIVAVTERDDVVVAPADGSAAPHVWTEDTSDTWLDLQRAIRWDG